MVDLIASVPLLVALVGAAIALAGAALARRHDRQQQARTFLLQSSERFARAAITALAALRSVTPPKRSGPGTAVHRNERLLEDVAARERALKTCRRAIDEVRVERASIRLDFHPKSWPAEWSRCTLAYLRAALETAETFYAEFAAQADSEVDEWRRSSGDRLRKKYKESRARAYWGLDNFFDAVATRLVAPTWNPAKIERATFQGPIPESHPAAADRRIGVPES
ncbi:hypothetical protein EV187_2902 [Agromyces ramosus]|uniref:Uncharacterized protein n=1 Tax=Agromyces ramosus TaxID=33879 RepID=A0A4Q7M8S2_9MICO|nr:hypothetical protein [Agromyces ramosus]RZS64515.1 hypothetical protein EV187_2902 [Agromyces ramosus]